MPKDPTKNIDRYKVRGGVINEYEYHENQQALAQNESKGNGQLIPGTPPEEKARPLRQATKVSKPQKDTKSTKPKKPAKSTKKAAKKATKNTLRGASAKKLAARKAARK